MRHYNLQFFLKKLEKKMGRSDSSTSVKSSLSNSKLGIEVLAERSLDESYNSGRDDQNSKSKQSKQKKLTGFVVDSDDDDDDDILVKKTGKQHHENIDDIDQQVSWEYFYFHQN